MSRKIEDLKKYFNFDIFADIYDQTRDVSKSFQNLVPFLFNKSKIKKNIRAIILEVGCGTGAILQFINKNATKSSFYIGIDISKKMLEKLKLKYKNGRYNLILADAYHLPFKNNIYNLVLMIRTIHILSRWKDSLKEIKRVLLKDGTLVIITGGEGIKILNECFSNKKYIELREKYGYPIFYYGANWKFVPKYIRDELNGFIETFQGTYNVSKKLSEIIKEFENQTMTWHTQVPKDIHDMIVNELKNCLIDKYGSLNINENQIGYFTIAFIKFSK